MQAAASALCHATVAASRRTPPHRRVAAGHRPIAALREGAATPRPEENFHRTPQKRKAPMKTRASRVLIGLVALMLGLVSVRPAAAAPEGTMTWGVHITLASRWLDPAETEGIITPFMVLYALHDALVKPMPAGHQHAEPRRVVDAVEGRAHLRVRHPQGREVPQRRAGHRRRREVLLRALQGRGREAPQGARARGPDRRSRAACASTSRSRGRTS